MDSVPSGRLGERKEISRKRDPINSPMVRGNGLILRLASCSASIPTGSRPHLRSRPGLSSSKVSNQKAGTQWQPGPQVFEMLPNSAATACSRCSKQTPKAMPTPGLACCDPVDRRQRPAMARRGVIALIPIANVTDQREGSCGQEACPISLSALAYQGRLARLLLH